ncbi:MAG: hypothetical protein ABJR46_16360 [Tateyamaria sp.]|uniref:hypothetical protein n=1 Tax=Tateyamaria sp. TaxID=1929288 RepID=UPI00329C1D0E
MLVELALRRYGLTSASDAYCVEFSQNGSEVVGIRAGHRLSSDAVEAFLPHLNELSHSKGVAFDVVNVQFAYDCIASQSCMIDFEHFMHRPRFQNKLIQMQFGLRESRLAITREGLMDGINRQMIRHRGARRLGATTMEIRSKGTEIAPSIAVRKIEGQFLDACLLTGEFSRLRSKIERLVRLADR